MATEGKIPMLGFKAAAIKFVSLFGFSVNDDVAAATPGIGEAISGSYSPTPLTGSYSAVAITGSAGPSPITGSVGD